MCNWNPKRRGDRVWNKEILEEIVTRKYPILIKDINIDPKGSVNSTQILKTYLRISTYLHIPTQSAGNRR